jgi:cellular nucleic acid-binding protein
VKEGWSKQVTDGLSFVYLQDCSNRTMDIDPCGICGRAGHLEDDCENVESQEQLTCMVCTTKGHLHCVPVPPPADRRVYCPHCAKNHTLEKCESYSEPTATNFATRTGGGRSVQTCYECNEPGHIAAECPIRLSGYSRGRGNCFKCGKPGHFAANCFNSNGNSSNGRHVTGRKRGRDVEDEYPDYNGYDYDDDEDSYSSSRGGKKNHGRGGSSRSRKGSSTQGYARLNEALPTRPYRNNNSSYGDRRRNNSRR